MFPQRTWLIVGIGIAATTMISVRADEPLDIGYMGKVISADKAVVPGANPRATTAGELYVEPSTLHSLGFEWTIGGMKTAMGVWPSSIGAVVNWCGGKPKTY